VALDGGLEPGELRAIGQDPVRVLREAERVQVRSLGRREADLRHAGGYVRGRSPGEPGLRPDPEPGAIAGVKRIVPSWMPSPDTAATTPTPGRSSRTTGS